MDAGDTEAKLGTPRVRGDEVHIETTQRLCCQSQCEVPAAEYGEVAAFVERSARLGRDDERGIRSGSEEVLGSEEARLEELQKAHAALSGRRVQCNA